MLNEPLDYIRLFNIFSCALAVTINLIKAYHLKLFSTMPVDGMIGFLGAMAWCIGYAVSATLAMIAEVESGIWTVVMIVPILWTFAAGLAGWHPKK